MTSYPETLGDVTNKEPFPTISFSLLFSMCRFIHDGNGAILTNALEIVTIHCVSAGMLLKQTIIKDVYLISTPPSDGRVWQMSSFGVFEYHFQADVGDCVPNFDR